jgi:uncharacterized membrane protein YfcA
VAARIDPNYVRATGLAVGLPGGLLIVWFSLLERDPPLLKLRGWPLLGTMAIGVTIGSFIGWYIAHRIAKRWLD